MIPGYHRPFTDDEAAEVAAVAASARELLRRLGADSVNISAESVSLNVHAGESSDVPHWATDGGWADINPMKTPDDVRVWVHFTEAAR